MKNTAHRKFITASLLAVAGLLVSTAATHAAIYHVDINTAALNLAPANANAPFSLDFQFNDGGVLGNNTATISNFTGTGVTGSANLFDGAAGAITSTVTFDNSGAFQELFQSFTPGAIIGFDVSLTQNSDGATPDSFVVGILDQNLFNITTNGIGDSLFQADITSGTITPNLGTGTGDYAGVTIAAVPEPGTALFGAMLIGVCVNLRRRRS
jgi:hypothetical protein